MEVVSLNLRGWTEEIHENLCPSRVRSFYTGVFCPAVLPPGEEAPVPPGLTLGGAHSQYEK